MRVAKQLREGSAHIVCKAAKPTLFLRCWEVAALNGCHLSPARVFPLRIYNVMDTVKPCMGPLYTPVAAQSRRQCLTSAGPEITLWARLLACCPAGLLHWFTSPYIHRMVYHRKTGMVDLESLTLLARPRRDIFHVTSVAYPQTIRPQATFTVSGIPSLQLPRASNGCGKLGIPIIPVPYG